MALLSDEELVSLARKYGEARGPAALAKVSGWTTRHAKRVMENPSGRINAENRERLLNAVPQMLEGIRQAEESVARLRRELRGHAITDADVGSPHERGTDDNDGRSSAGGEKTG